MRLIALSDLHGNLIHIDDTCDVIVIAGDWSPLYIQHDYSAMMKWVNDKFIPWMKRLNASHVVFIAGNHDLACTYSYFYNDLVALINRHGASDKIHYLNRSSVTIDGIKFYGIPDTEGYYRWAFMKAPNYVNYNFDNDTYVLVTHQPPNIEDIGYVTRYHENFGSDLLSKSIRASNIRLNICGHIHTGSHERYLVEADDRHTIVCCNVSILDEDYNVAFKPTILEI